MPKFRFLPNESVLCPTDFIICILGIVLVALLLLRGGTVTNAAFKTANRRHAYSYRWSVHGHHGGKRGTNQVVMA